METALPAISRPRFLQARAIVIAIGIFKLLHGCLMILLAVAALELTRPEIIQHVRDWADELDVGPYRRHVGHWVATGLLHLNVKTLVEVTLGAGIYATVFFVEGAGLLLDKLWAEWMVVVSTSLLIPVEISEIYRHRGIVMTITFAINIAILVYLIIHVRHHIRARQAHMNSTGAATSG